MARSYDPASQTRVGENGFIQMDIADTVSSLYQFANFTRAACKLAAKEYASDAEMFMKEQAPWQDRTGDARRNLKAEYFEETQGSQWYVGVALQHGVSYGIFLETNGLYTPSYRSRRRPILVPTAEKAVSQQLLERLRKQFSKIAKF